MTSITEIAPVDLSTDQAAPAGPLASPGALPGQVDGVDDGAIERELNEMDVAADALRNEGVISEAEARSKKEEVARARKLFHELAPDARAAIVKRRRELGVQILNRQLAGAAVVAANVKLNHTRLRPLFEQWWPYMNRMSLNLQRFGESTFKGSELATINQYLDGELTKLEDYVDEQLRVGRGYREQCEAKMKENGDIIFRPTVTRPSLEMDVEVYSRFAVRVLNVLAKFDQTMDEFDFLVWNGLRDQSDVNDEVRRFLRKFQPLGIRSYTTHLKLMTTVRGV